MITNGEFVSRVINNLKGLSKDTRISRRFILSTGRTKARFLMTQKLDEMTLFREDAIISNIECFKLESIEAIKCDIVEIRNCKNIMKSCSKIPEGLFGKNGSSIILVQNIDGSRNYEYITPRQYANLKNRQRYNRKKVGYYTIKNEYLYLLDSTNEIVNIQLIALDQSEAENSCNCKEKEGCKSKWDFDFICSDRLLEYVLKDTLQEVASIYRTSVEDENPNMDENQKTATIR